MVTFSACEGEFREEGEQFGGGNVIKNGDEGVECLATKSFIAAATAYKE